MGDSHRTVTTSGLQPNSFTMSHHDSLCNTLSVEMKKSTGSVYLPHAGRILSRMNRISTPAKAQKNMTQKFKIFLSKDKPTSVLQSLPDTLRHYTDSTRRFFVIGRLEAIAIALRFPFSFLCGSFFPSLSLSSEQGRYERGWPY